MVERDPETTLNNRTTLASAGKRPVEIERPFCPTGRAREHNDVGHATVGPLLEMLDMQFNLKTQPGRMRCSTCGTGKFRGCRREHGSHWGPRDAVPLKVQGQLKGAGKEVTLQLIYETGQRPESQITTF